MTTASMLSGSPGEVPPLNGVGNVAATLKIRITDLTPWDIQCEFDPAEYQSTAKVKTPLDISYAKATSIPIGSYLEVTFELVDNKNYDAIFMRDTPSEKIQHPAVTTGNLTAEKVMADLKRISDKSVSVLMRRIDLTGMEPAVFGLGIHFSNKNDPGNSIKIIFDPTVPNDGS